MSLTRSPPISRSPLVCRSSPQIMRRNVVLPQPEGPSKTMNSPFGTLSEMPFTAGTSPNFLTMSLVTTAAIRPPRRQRNDRADPIRQGRILSVRWTARDRAATARSGRSLSGSAGPFLEDGFASLRRRLDRIFGTRLAGCCLRHHVVEDEGIVDFVRRRGRRSRIARDGGPLVGVLQDRQLGGRRRCRIVRQDRHRLWHEIGEAGIVVALARLEGLGPVVAIIFQ